MSRKLSTQENENISTFMKKEVHAYIQQAQYTPETAEFVAEQEAQEVIDIKSLLEQLISKASNDNLLSLLKMKVDAYQDVLLRFLTALDRFIANFNDDAQSTIDKIIEKTLGLKDKTSLSHVTTTLNSLATYSPNVGLHNIDALFKKSREVFDAKAKTDIAKGHAEEYYYETYVDENDLRKQLVAASPKLLLYRSRSDLSAYKQHAAISNLSPTRPHLPVTNIGALKPKKLF